MLALRPVPLVKSKSSIRASLPPRDGFRGFLVRLLVVYLCFLHKIQAQNDANLSRKHIILKRASPVFEEYHDVSWKTHDSSCERLRAAGYRPISLSIHGERLALRYSAVWVPSANIDWKIYNSLDTKRYYQIASIWNRKGYQVTLVGATGPGNHPVFAAVLERGATESELKYWSMSRASLVDRCSEARAMGLTMVAFAPYGEKSHRRYAAVWHRLPNTPKWTLRNYDNLRDFEEIGNAQINVPGMAPRAIWIAGQEVIALYEDFKQGSYGPVRASYDLSDLQLERAVAQNKNLGLLPISIKANSEGGETRFTAVFAPTHTRAERRWTETGKSDERLRALDQVMKDFMKNNAVRSAQLAVSTDGMQRHAKGYTWAEEGYRITQPTDRFPLASLSKVFTEAAVDMMINAGQLKQSTRVFPFLKVGGGLDGRSDTITIEHLLAHRGGFENYGSGTDPVFNMREIAQELQIDRAMTMHDFVLHLYGTSLDFDPGTKTEYSNEGFVLLAAAIEKASGMSYFDYLRSAVLDPVGIGDQVRIAPTGREGWPSSEPMQEAIEGGGLGLNPLNVLSTRPVPQIYGGDGAIREVAVGAIGLAASASAVTRLVDHFPFMLDRRFWWHDDGLRTGSMAGTETAVTARWDGFTWCYMLNTRDLVQPDALHWLGVDINKVLDAARS
ncbi:MAG: hypothetical protein M1833_006163 [Piccolia ochrophora]|nr:MAG: hypothetical protein M1833_006163 [Piccolia ochrophora]